jgi:hypothetical protein
MQAATEKPLKDRQGLIGSSTKEIERFNQGFQMQYQVSRLTAPFAVDADWQKPAWKEVAAARLAHFMGEKPAHFPDTQLKMVYDDEAVYVIFGVQDQYVRATRTAYQQNVFKDSCVEFFFKPNDDDTENYFNLETNCCGAALFAFQAGPRQGEVRIPSQEFETVTLAHSLPGPIDPELVEPLTWSVEYRLPLNVLRNYCSVVPPAPGVVWKANFFKIADESSQPHYLTWAPVDRPKPDFHQPRFFGDLVFA